MNNLNHPVRALAVTMSSAFTLLVGFSPIGGCSTTHSEPPPTATSTNNLGYTPPPGNPDTREDVSSISTSRSELIEARRQVDRMLDALSELREPQIDLRPAMDRYSSELRKTQAMATEFDNRTSDMNVRAAAYQRRWQADTSALTNPELRSAAEGRFNVIRGKFDLMMADANEARNAYQPFMSDLRDVERYLNNDLTPAGVQAAAPVMDKAEANGRTLKSKLTELIESMDVLASEMAPGSQTHVAPSTPSTPSTP